MKIVLPCNPYVSLSFSLPLWLSFSMSVSFSLSLCYLSQCLSLSLTFPLWRFTFLSVCFSLSIYFWLCFYFYIPFLFLYLCFLLSIFIWLSFLFFLSLYFCFWGHLFISVCLSIYLSLCILRVLPKKHLKTIIKLFKNILQCPSHILWTFTSCTAT